MQERNDGYFVIVSSQEGIIVKEGINVIYFSKLH